MIARILFFISMLFVPCPSIALADNHSPAYVKIVKASWYGPGFHGRRTSNGEIFNKWKLTAAHPDLPFGTKVRVTCVANGKSVMVRINDRGPFIPGRKIDLSYAAAQKIDMIHDGVATVKIEVVT